MPGVIKTERRRVLVHWTDTHGIGHTDERQVFFTRGFGEYVRHQRRMYLVDPMATTLTLGDRTPSVPDPDAGA